MYNLRVHQCELSIDLGMVLQIDCCKKWDFQVMDAGW